MLDFFKRKNPPPPSDDTPSNGPPKSEKGLFARLKEGLQKTRHTLSGGLSNLFLGKKTIDAELLTEVEDILLSADVGVAATKRILKSLTEKLKRDELKDGEALQAALKQYLTEILLPCELPLTLPEKAVTSTMTGTESKKPTVILMVGVNGSGKTTTIGKLAKRLQNEGKSVLLAAGDTFRAAAIEQLKVWGERNSLEVIAQHTGADSASVIFDAFQAAIARNVDVLIADTAGRLHTQGNLMEELKKVVRVVSKLDPSAPHEIMLILDAGIGQNALNQATEFHKAVAVTGITLTKLDGTAKGGIIFNIAETLKLPIRFIGIGEKIDDLRPFEAREFVEALFTTDDY